MSNTREDDSGFGLIYLLFAVRSKFAMISKALYNDRGTKCLYTDAGKVSGEKERGIGSG